MKKKNVLMMALSLCLVAVIAVGGTLAYLSDTDGAVTNTFQFAAGIDVTCLRISRYLSRMKRSPRIVTRAMITPMSYLDRT